MANVLIEENTLSAIGDAIRGKTGKSDLIYPADMAGEIDNISAGVELPSLTNPATAAGILLGLEAIDDTGRKITGEYEPYVLPEMTDPAAAEDILLGKEAVGPDGKVRVGTLEVGGGSGDFSGINIISMNSAGKYIEAEIVGLSEVPMSAFYGHDVMTRCVLPETINKVGITGFYGCKALTNFSLPDGVTSVGLNAFANTHNLGLSKLPANLTTLGYASFMNSAVSFTEFPEGVKDIPERCFYLGTTSYGRLSTLNMPAVKTIGASAFYQHRELTKVTIGSPGNPVTSIASDAFSVCTALTEIEVYTSSPTSGLAGSPWGASNATVTYKQA